MKKLKLDKIFKLKGLGKSSNIFNNTSIGGDIGGSITTSLLSFGRQLNQDKTKNPQLRNAIDEALDILDLDNDTLDNDDPYDFLKMNLKGGKTIGVKKRVNLKKKPSVDATQKTIRRTTRRVDIDNGVGSIGKNDILKKVDDIPNIGRLSKEVPNTGGVPRGGLGGKGVPPLIPIVPPILVGGIPPVITSDEPKQSTRYERIVAYPDDFVTPVVEITAFEYKFDKDNIVGNRVATNRLFTVVLPIQSNISINHSANFSNYNSVWYKLSNALGSTGVSINNFNPVQMWESLKSFYGTVASSEHTVDIATIGALQFISTNFLKVTDEGAMETTLKYAKVATGTAINPMNISYYTNHNIIEHSFSFNLTPKRELHNIMFHKIISLLEEYQLSRMSTALGGTLVDYPCVFQMEFKTHQNGNNIKTVFDIPDSVLTNIRTTYSNNTNYFVTIDGTRLKNVPINIQLELTFKEMQMRTASDMLALWR